jgi:Protein of unknown function (DUF3307)
VIWVEVFAVFMVSHLVGDFALQTEWQATHKRGGLGPNPTARRALLAHVSSYTLAFVPAFIWLADEIGALVLVLAALLFVTHLVEDDGRLLDGYIRRVKHTEPGEHPLVTTALDQTLHVVILFGLALLAVG